MKTEQGICPMCEEQVEYGPYQMKDDSLCYEVECQSKHCDWMGTEWYRTEYDNTADITGMPL